MSYPYHRYIYFNEAGEAGDFFNANAPAKSFMNIFYLLYANGIVIKKHFALFISPAYLSVWLHELAALS